MTKIKFPKGIDTSVLSVNDLSSVKEGQTFRIEVTPSMAKDWLKTNQENRKQSPTNANHLTRQIQNGKWMFNGESIKFDEDGRLVDGQHRLIAVVTANKSIDTAVSFGISRSAFHTMDTGKNRSASDVLSAKNYKIPNVLAAVARQLLALESGDKQLLNENTIRRSRFDNEDILNYIVNNPDITNIVTEAFNTWQKMTLKIVSSSVFCTMYYLFYKRHTADARTFMESVALGTGLEQGSGVWALRHSLEKMYNEREKRKYSHYHKCSVFARCWNAFRKKEVIISPRFRKVEEMPTII